MCLPPREPRAPLAKTVRPRGRQVWTGAGFEDYAGERSAEALVFWAKQQLGAGAAAAAAPPPRQNAEPPHTELQRELDRDDGDGGAQQQPTLEPGRLQVWPGLQLPTQVFVPSTAVAAAAAAAGRRLPVLVYLHGTPPGGRFDVKHDHGLPQLLQDDPEFRAGFQFIALFPCSGLPPLPWC